MGNQTGKEHGQKGKYRKNSQWNSSAGMLENDGHKEKLQQKGKMADTCHN